MLTSAYPPTKLVKLRQAKTVSALDDERVYIWHIQTGLDDGGADQDVALAVSEVHHHLFQFRLRHLAVPGKDAGVRYQPAYVIDRQVDRPHTVVEVEHLTTPFHLPQDGFLDHVLRVFRDEGLDRQPRLRGRLYRGQVAQARERHIKRARDGGGA